MIEEQAFKADDAQDESSLLGKDWRLAKQCEAQGIFRFSVVEGRRFYEPPFVSLHQETMGRIRDSVDCPTALYVVRSNVHIAFEE